MAETLVSLRPAALGAESLACELVAYCGFVSHTGYIGDSTSQSLLQSAQGNGSVVVGIARGQSTGLALSACAQGRQVVAVVTDHYSARETAVLRACGCEVVKAYSASGAETCHGLALQLAQQLRPALCVNDMDDACLGLPEQPFADQANSVLPEGAPQVDMVVAWGVPSLRLAAAIKARHAGCKVVGVVVDDQKKRGQADVWAEVTDRQAHVCCRQLVATHAILGGVMSGAVLAAGLEAAKGLGQGQRCLLLLPDPLGPYTDTVLSDEWMQDQGYVVESASAGGQAQDKWRGAAVGDLDLPPPVSVLPTATCEEALSLMHVNDFDTTPVINARKRLVGLLARDQLQQAMVAGTAKGSDPVSSVMQKFSRSTTGQPYVPITLDTPLAELEKFFEAQHQHNSIAFITDDNNWCLGVVTKVDLLTFRAHRGHM
eukprot:comp23890_c0_seq1/m.41960 comp23890_c0_seq1/g.41960  ORF comp23890_c0_seq1/g.41960 comp23890_c0_seq1/m.41960 type:complete len:430 (-) comp23890_c0_seq1:436-1725(-)